MKLQCPYCQSRMDAGQEFERGTHVRCPACSKSFAVDPETVVNEAAAAVPSPSMKIRNDPDGVRIIGIDIPFLNMVKLLVEIAIASIPAMIIIFLLILGFSFLLSLIGMAAGIAR